MIDIAIGPNGALHITATEFGRECISNGKQGGLSYWTIWAELIEEYSCNGSYTHFDAGQGNPFVGLTSAPCIAEEMDYLDNGDCQIIGRFWYFDDYCLRDDLQELADGETVIYTLATE